MKLRSQILVCPLTTNWATASIILSQEDTSVLQNMIGRTRSKCFQMTSWFSKYTFNRHRDKIQDWHPDFLITANSWPCFLYEEGRYNPNNPAIGLFKGSLLLHVSLCFLHAKVCAIDLPPHRPSNLFLHHPAQLTKKTPAPIWSSPVSVAVEKDAPTSM